MARNLRLAFVRDLSELLCRSTASTVLTHTSILWVSAHLFVYFQQPFTVFKFSKLVAPFPDSNNNLRWNNSTCAGLTEYIRPKTVKCPWCFFQQKVDSFFGFLNT